MDTVEYFDNLGPFVQSIVSLTSSLRVISLTVLADSIYNKIILIFFAETMWVAFATYIFFQQNISAYLRITHVNLGPGPYWINNYCRIYCKEEKVLICMAVWMHRLALALAIYICYKGPFLKLYITPFHEDTERINPILYIYVNICIHAISCGLRPVD